MIISNLLIIAGTGNKSGKTTLACRLISQFRNRDIMAVKITPHFHETTVGLFCLAERSGYSIYEETNEGTNKDTSRMLKAGASKVFFAKVTDNHLPDAFLEIMELIPSSTPIVCESPALRYFFEPGLFTIMKSDKVNNNKDINQLLQLPHVMFSLEEIENNISLPIGFEEGKWISL